MMEKCRASPAARWYDKRVACRHGGRRAAPDSGEEDVSMHVWIVRQALFHASIECVRGLGTARRPVLVGMPGRELAEGKMGMKP